MLGLLSMLKCSKNYKTFTPTCNLVIDYNVKGFFFNQKIFLEAIMGRNIDIAHSNQNLKQNSKLIIIIWKNL